MERIYESIIKEQFETCEQMIFFSGPRRVGKTTLGLSAKKLTENFIYLNWDNRDHRKIILEGPKAISEQFALNKLQK